MTLIQKHLCIMIQWIKNQTREVLPEEMQAHAPPPGSPAGQLLPGPRRKRVANEEEDGQEADNTEQEEHERRPRNREELQPL